MTLINDSRDRQNSLMGRVDAGIVVIHWAPCILPTNPIRPILPTLLTWCDRCANERFK